MAQAEMRPARPARLRWLAPAGVGEVEFAARRARLEHIAAAPRSREVYRAKRRAIHRIDDPVLGPLAVKELRNRSPLRSLRFGWLQEHRGLREFRIGAEFAARGGATPGFLAAALERGPLGLRRLLLFLPWLEGAVTLTGYLRARGPEPDAVLLDAVAACLVESARLGLVHGRHSSENLLVTEAAAGAELHVIDFAYSRLGPGLDSGGLVDDAARVAHRLLHEGACSRRAVERLFDRIAELAWSPTEASGRRAALDRRLAAALRRSGQSPVAARLVRTT